MGYKNQYIAIIGPNLLLAWNRPTLINHFPLKIFAAYGQISVAEVVRDKNEF